MHKLWRLNRTETVAVQTNYVLARCGLQMSNAIGWHAPLQAILRYERRNVAFRKASVRSHASAAAAASWASGRFGSKNQCVVPG